MFANTLIFAIFLTNFMFQFGEFYSDGDFWSDLTVQIIGALIGAFAAIWLFFRQLRINKATDESKKIDFENEKLRYFAGTLNSVVELILMQIKRIDEFVEKVSINYIDVPLLRIYPAHEVDRLANKINHEDYFHAFTNRNDQQKNAADKISSINAALYYFDGVFKQIEPFLEKERMYDYQKKIVYREHINNAQRKLSLLLMRLKREGNFMLYNPLNHLLITHLERTNEDPANLVMPKEHFLDPLIELVLPYLEDTDFYAIADEVRSARVKFSEIIMSNHSMKEEFVGYRNDLESALEKLKTDAQILITYGYSK